MISNYLKIDNNKQKAQKRPKKSQSEKGALLIRRMHIINSKI